MHLRLDDIKNGPILQIRIRRLADAQEIMRTLDCSLGLEVYGTMVMYSIDLLTAGIH